MPDVFVAHATWQGLAAAAASRWSWEPFTIVSVVASAVVYAAGVRAIWRRAGHNRGIRRWRVIAFNGGLTTLAVALLSPLAWLSSVLFSAHMTQHELLMLVAAPLLVVGQPLYVVLWAAPPRWREAWARLAARRSVLSAWRTATSPLSVFLLHAAALWVWHAPRLYEAALHHDGIHALQHVSFVLTAALFWWGIVHGRYGRTGYGVAVVYVFLTAVHSSVLGALMTVAPAVWYPEYARAGQAWHVDALADQQVGGLLMWIPGGAIFILFGLALCAAWLGESERRAGLGMVAQKGKQA
jgi:cytochrome c oxidase assembly factor CtaG